MLKRRIRLFLYKWHRRIGLMAAVFVIILSVTGLLLNHTSKFSLSNQYPQSSFWLWPYDTVELRGYFTSKGWFYHKDHKVWFSGQGESQAIPECEGPIIGVAELPDEMWLLCQHQLISWTDGRIAETLDKSLFNVSIEKIASISDALAIQNQNQWYLLDVGMLSAETPINRQLSTDKLLTASVLPAELQINRHISLERVMLDIHSGRWFGSWGVYIMDAAALFLLFLAMTGFWVWISRKRR